MGRLEKEGSVVAGRQITKWGLRLLSTGNLGPGNEHDILLAGGSGLPANICDLLQAGGTGSPANICDLLLAGGSGSPATFCDNLLAGGSGGSPANIWQWIGCEDCSPVRRGRSSWVAARITHRMRGAQTRRLRTVCAIIIKLKKKNSNDFIKVFPLNSRASLPKDVVSL